MEIFGVLDVSHIRNDRFRIETMFLSVSEFLLSKLLTLHVMGLLFFELKKISRTGVVGLGGDLRNVAFFLCQLGTLKLFDFLVFAGLTDKLFHICCRVQS